MARYVIRACKSRKWYVDGYLVPSMKNQGIPDDKITVYVDFAEKGCLDSCLAVFRSVPDDDGGTWFLQDDIVISKRFRELTEKNDSGIVCGHCFPLHGDRTWIKGYVDPNQMWFSFPCIRIPHKLALEFADWFDHIVKPKKMYPEWVNAGKYDDTLFDVYMREHHMEARILNLTPNLVAHIDYLIGGSVILGNGEFRRIEEPYFDEIDVIEELQKNLKGEKGNDYPG